VEDKDLVQGAIEQAAQPIGHPGEAIAAAGVTDDGGSNVAGEVKQNRRTLSKRPEKPKAPRPPVTYRAQRRNEAKRAKKKMYRIGADVQEGSSPSVELNRSPNFPRAQSYSYAREISPVPERPVR
jgi:hypothetical protein